MRYLLGIAALTIAMSLQGQDLDQQYRELKENTETFNEYKVIKRTQLDQFWSIVQDSLGAVRSDLSARQDQVTNLQAEIERLNSVNAQQNEEIIRSEFNSSHIQFLGMHFQKWFYILLNIIIIAGLVIGLTFYVLRFNYINSKSKEISADLEKLETEHMAYRRKAFDRHIKLKREMQTLRNKLVELTGSENGRKVQKV